MCDKHNPRSPGNGADWYCTCIYVADHTGPHRCTCGFQWPTPAPDGLGAVVDGEG